MDIELIIFIFFRLFVEIFIELPIFIVLVTAYTR